MNVKPAKTAVVKSRAGEGIVVSVDARLSPQPDGSTAIETTIDLASLPVPQRRYFADAIDVVVTDDYVVLAFGQRRIAGKGLRSLVAVSLTPETVRRFILTCKDFYPLIEALTQSHGMTAKLERMNEEPEQSAALVANLLAVAQAQREVVMDFYHVSAFALRDVATRKSLAIDPMLRVDISVALTKALIERIKELEPTLPGEIK